jgi:RNase P subunit RPR2
VSVVIKNKIHKAKFKHYCDDCRTAILPGEKYRRLFGSAYSLDKPHELKLCQRCTFTEDDGHTPIQNSG